MATQYVTSIYPDGVYLYTVTTDPNGAITAPSGSLALRTDNGNASIYLNDNDATAWVRLLDVTATGDLDLTGVSQITLLDNANPALSIGSTGTLDLLVFITTTGVERVVYNGTSPFTIATGGLTVQAGTVALPNNTLNVATAAVAALAGTVAASLTLRVSHPGGAVTVSTVLPARAGGWRVLDAMVVASGAGLAGSSVRVRTTAPADVSSALNLDNTVAAGTVNRTTALTNTVFASGATIDVTGTGTPAASNVFITLAPL